MKSLPGLILGILVAFDPSQVLPDSGTYFAITANSGGYAIPMTAASTYSVTFSGTSLPFAVTKTAVISGSSVQLDVIVGNMVEIELRPHDLRGYAATYASRSGTPIEIVSKVILRHADLSTTQRYPGKVNDSQAIRWIEILYGVI